MKININLIFHLKTKNLFLKLDATQFNRKLMEVRTGPIFENYFQLVFKVVWDIWNNLISFVVIYYYLYIV